MRLGKNDDPKARILHCDLQGTHLSLIKNMGNYAKQFQCDECKSLFTTSTGLQLHKRKQSCWTDPTPIYNAGNYDIDSENVFEQLARKGLHLKESSDRFDTHFAVLDFETFNQKEKLNITSEMTYENRLELLCGAIASTLDPVDFEGAFLLAKKAKVTEIYSVLC